MIDKIETLGSSLIQHGKLNDRIYLMHMKSEDMQDLPIQMTALAEKNNYSKIFAKVPSIAVEYFRKHDYFKEAYIPNFYGGKSGMYCLAKYFNQRRAFVKLKDIVEIQRIIEISRESRRAVPAIPEDFHIRELCENDIKSLVELYETVFKSYPFPIFKADFIRETMQGDSRYFGAFQGNILVAAASMEINLDEQSAEMTDFATHSDYRGNGLSLALLFQMEEVIRGSNIKVMYTFARALSPAMNITFTKAGYLYGGTLKNNTNIAGKIESMNVWHKSTNWSMH